jgi:hypothetical protein
MIRHGHYPFRDRARAFVDSVHAAIYKLLRVPVWIRT